MANDLPRVPPVAELARHVLGQHERLSHRDLAARSRHDSRHEAAFVELEAAALVAGALAGAALAALAAPAVGAALAGASPCAASDAADGQVRPHLHGLALGLAPLAAALAATFAALSAALVVHRDLLVLLDRRPDAQRPAVHLQLLEAPVLQGRRAARLRAGDVHQQAAVARVEGRAGEERAVLARGDLYQALVSGRFLLVDPEDGK
mmetsp:Transcript_90359/g.244961  ORF Transcript_90359/g.244961 Transcript_90359/m.244961 type:complete len:207 (-) Transcript_90359:583-1203(-)